MEDVGMGGGQVGLAALQRADEVPGQPNAWPQRSLDQGALAGQLLGAILAKVKQAGILGFDD